MKHPISLILGLFISEILISCGGGGQGGGNSGSTDTTPPSVLFTSPISNAAGVAVNPAITATFSEPLSAATMSTASFTLNGATAVAGAVTYSGTTATFTPSVNLAYSNTYTATITNSVKDIAGNAMVANYSWTFTTGNQGNAYDMSAISPNLSVTSSLAGVVHVDVAALPGSNANLGATPPAWEIRYLQGSTPLTADNWSTATLAKNLAGVLPVTPVHSFDVLLPTDKSDLWIGIRSLDSVGNLGSFISLTTPNVSTALTIPVVRGAPNADYAGRVVMKVADVDGDGFDDVILAYPNDQGLDGRIRIWFGSSGGLSATPMTLVGSLTPGSNGLLGIGNSFEVADVDSDGVDDVIAGETDCATTAYINVWTGAAIATAKAANATPTPIRLSDGTNLLGGTIRAVGKATGGSGGGSDLLVTNFTSGCGTPSTLKAVVLPRGGAWLVNANTGTFSATGAVSFVLPNQPNATLDATWSNLHGTTSRDSVVLSFVEPGVSHDLRAFSGDQITSGSTIPWSSGVQLTVPASVLSTDSFGLVIGGGRDAIGDATSDLVVSYPESKRVLVYDGAQLLSAGVGPATFATLDPISDIGGDAGFCAELLPDLNGDGKAEYAGCANTGTTSSAVYVGFGYTGSAPPWTTSFFPSWNFKPARSQKIGGPAGVPWGQAIGVGHISSITTFDLVVLSHSGTGSDTIRLMH